MGYIGEMDARKATTPAQPAADDEWTDVPIGEAEWAAMPEALRASIIAAEAAVERGEWIDGDTMMAKLNAMVRRHQARAAKQN